MLCTSFLRATGDACCAGLFLLVRLCYCIMVICFSVWPLVC